MKQFEYKTLTFSDAHQDGHNIRESELNIWGQLGWEMVNVIREPYKVIVFFKREINE